MYIPPFWGMFGFHFWAAENGHFCQFAQFSLYTAAWGGVFGIGDFVFEMILLLSRASVFVF